MIFISPIALLSNVHLASIKAACFGYFISIGFFISIITSHNHITDIPKAVYAKVPSDNLTS
jgi:hypothetical protein